MHVRSGRKPIFPGKDYVDQLQVICKLIGTPSEVRAIGQQAADNLASPYPLPPGPVESVREAVCSLCVDPRAGLAMRVGAMRYRMT